MHAHRNREGSSSGIVALVVVGVIGVATIVLSVFSRTNATGPTTVALASPTADVNMATPPVVATARKSAGDRSFPVTIMKPSGPPRVATGAVDSSGNEVTVSCSTCHATRAPNIENKFATDLNEFHGSLDFNHGNISCLSCHNPNDYDPLRLADGSRVEFADVMVLCGQCHGPQMRDYEHGAHGGMSGYWDLSRGPRVRNNCIDCHQAHSPQFPKMRPTFKPRDRFLKAAGHEGTALQTPTSHEKSTNRDGHAK